MYIATDRANVQSEESKLERKILVFKRLFGKDSRGTKIIFKYFSLEFSRNIVFFYLKDFPKLSIKNQGRALMLNNTAFWILLCSVSD